MIPSMNPVHGETDDGTSEMLCGDAAASGAMGTISRLSLLVGVVVLDERRNLCCSCFCSFS